MYLLILVINHLQIQIIVKYSFYYYFHFVFYLIIILLKRQENKSMLLIIKNIKKRNKTFKKLQNLSDLFEVTGGSFKICFKRFFKIEQFFLNLHKS